MTRMSKKVDFANKMTSFLAQNRVKEPLGGNRGVYNQDKFHMILDEIYRLNSDAPEFSDQ